jgi:hypothetical protein
MLIQETPEKIFQLLQNEYISAAKSAAEIPRMKFRFASYFEHFEAVSSLLLANCLRPLRH